jgi:dihydrolipoamide dehydrogenase
MKILVIGGGPAGRTAAMEAAHIGEEVTLIEKEHVGGTCLHEGCTVISGLNDIVRFLQDSKRYKEMGIIPQEPQIDYLKVAQGVKETTTKIEKVLKRETKAAGAELVQGNAILKEDKVKVDEVEFNYDKLIIATGSRPFIPPITGVETALTYRDVLNLKKIPEKLIIVGGSVIAAEYAGIFSSFGSDVNVLSRREFLGKLDNDIKDYVVKNLLMNVKIQENIAVDEITSVGVHTSQGELEGRVFLATGMTPNSEIASEMVDIGSKNEIIVDQQMKTNHPDIYAAGDVVGKIGTTPVARREGIVAARNACGVSALMDYHLIPQSITLYYYISTLSSEDSSEAVEGRIPGSAGPGSFWRALDGDTGFTKMSVDLESGDIKNISSISPSSRTSIPYLAKMIKDGYKTSDFDDFMETHPSTDAIYKLLHFFAKYE